MYAPTRDRKSLRYVSPLDFALAAGWCYYYGLNRELNNAIQRTDEGLSDFHPINVACPNTNTLVGANWLSDLSANIHNSNVPLNLTQHLNQQDL